MTTSIDDIVDKNLFEEPSQEYKYSFSDIMNLELSEDIRIKILVEIHEENKRDGNPAETLSIINQLSGIYYISGSSIIKKFLLKITTDQVLNPVLNFEAVRSLCEYDINDNQSCEILLEFCLKELKIKSEIFITYLLNTLTMIYKNEDMKEKVLECIRVFIQNPNYDIPYKYGFVRSFKSNELFYLFIDNITDIRYLILSYQYLLINDKDADKKNQNIEKLLEIARNDNNEYNARADACDTILKMNDNKEASDILIGLGKIDKSNNTIYGNAQNVHTLEITECVEQAIEFLINKVKILEITDSKSGKSREITLEDIETIIPNKSDNIKNAFIRIHNDNILYGKFAINLEHILIRLWTYIQLHNHKDELEKRLIEELNEMSGTCSSGYVTRLINVMSGFGDFEIRISWADQIYANFTARLNKRIQDLPDEEDEEEDEESKETCYICGKLIYKSDRYELKECEHVYHKTCISRWSSNVCPISDCLLEFKKPEITREINDYKPNKNKIIEQMAEDPSSYRARYDFVTFFRKNLASIVSELQSEFIPLYLTETDFELYLKRAIWAYDTGGDLKLKF